jgi:hypothetical protein
MPISNALKRAVLGLTSDEVVVTLLTFSGAGFTTFRVCDNDTDIVSGGQTYIAFPFSIQLPDDGDEAPAAVLQIANVDRTIGQAIDAADDEIFVNIKLVLASNPDNPEKEFDGLKISRAPRNALIVEGELTSAQFANEPYTRIRATPGRFPGLFP